VISLRAIVSSTAYDTANGAIWEFILHSFPEIDLLIPRVFSLGSSTNSVLSLASTGTLLSVRVPWNHAEGIEVCATGNVIGCLPACHLQSKWKGILYTASVRTATDEVYPVAFAIMSGNEDESGWN
jgi:hypothetical protein